MADESKLPKPAVNIVSLVRDFQNDVAKAVAKAYSGLEEVVAEKYKNQEWDKRRNDFAAVEKLAEKHSSILEFIGEYILDPLYVSYRCPSQLRDRPLFLPLPHRHFPPSPWPWPPRPGLAG